MKFIVLFLSLLAVHPLRSNADTIGTSVKGFTPVISEPTWLVSPQKKLMKSPLPPEIRLRHSNNNVAIAQHDGRIYLAWRSAPTHFASKKTDMNIISSADFGANWDFETQLNVGRDIREPFFLSLNGRLFFNCMILGKNPLAFKPKGALRIERLSPGVWSEPVAGGEPEEMLWEMKVRNGIAFRTSYRGNHYEGGASQIEVFFKKSNDGEKWVPVREGTSGVVYRGGVSEVGFDFDSSGQLWALTRNEDGDSSGWGSHIASANPRALGLWKFPPQSNPNRFDSPRAFEFNGEVFFVARHDLGGPFDLGKRWLGFDLQKWIYLFRYSSTPKGTSLYWMDRENNELKRIADLPGNGDTAFPSIVRLSENRFLVANYTSPLGHENESWISGQLSPKGTSLYWVEIKWESEVNSGYAKKDSKNDAEL